MLLVVFFVFLGFDRSLPLGTGIRIQTTHLLVIYQVLASRANSSVKKYIAQYRVFRVYLKSRRLSLVLLCRCSSSRVMKIPFFSSRD